ncbi:hypothetical protein MP228_001859 [Amoeboaphelidium protococcarum]|nr:hypothetical protein MP228_001859 [Amoeboaphelidium protococcarum]
MQRFCSSLSSKVRLRPLSVIKGVEVNVNGRRHYSATTSDSVSEIVKQVASTLKESKSQNSTSSTTSTSTSSSETVNLIKDAKFEFQKVWNNLEQKMGGSERMVLPYELVWLMGSPASGKGTNTPAILKARGITNAPIVMSNLLNSAEMKKRIDRGEMVDDAKALELLLTALLKCDTNVGVLIDGFPRTEVQVEYLKLLHEKMHELRNVFLNTEHQQKFNRPIFRIVVLYIDEKESVRRQLMRGKLVRKHNELVHKTSGSKQDLLVERVTDYDEDLIRARYKIFTQHFSALQKLKQLFPFHLINAEGSIEEVVRSIWREFEYQSSQELDQSTYDAIQHIPVADKIGVHARQELVRRLDSYMFHYRQQFTECIQMVEQLFVPAIQRHAISGYGIVRVDGEHINSERQVDMMMDILSERGYHVTVDKRIINVPVKVHRDTFEIISQRNPVYVFKVRFAQHGIRGVFSADDPKEYTNTLKVSE